MVLNQQVLSDKCIHGAPVEFSESQPGLLAVVFLGVRPGTLGYPCDPAFCFHLRILPIRCRECCARFVFVRLSSLMVVSVTCAAFSESVGCAVVHIVMFCVVRLCAAMVGSRRFT